MAMPPHFALIDLIDRKKWLFRFEFLARFVTPGVLKTKFDKIYTICGIGKLGSMYDAATIYSEISKLKLTNDEILLFIPEMLDKDEIVTHVRNTLNALKTRPWLFPYDIRFMRRLISEMDVKSSILALSYVVIANYLLTVENGGLTFKAKEDIYKKAYDLTDFIKCFEVPANNTRITNILWVIVFYLQNGRVQATFDVACSYYTVMQFNRTTPIEFEPPGRSHIAYTITNHLMITCPYVLCNLMTSELVKVLKQRPTSGASYIDEGFYNRITASLGSNSFRNVEYELFTWVIYTRYFEYDSATKVVTVNLTPDSSPFDRFYESQLYYYFSCKDPGAVFKLYKISPSNLANLKRRSADLEWLLTVDLSTKDKIISILAEMPTVVSVTSYWKEFHSKVDELKDDIVDNVETNPSKIVPYNLKDTTMINHDSTEFINAYNDHFYEFYKNNGVITRNQNVNLVETFTVLKMLFASAFISKHNGSDFSKMMVSEVILEAFSMQFFEQQVFCKMVGVIVYYFMTYGKPKVRPQFIGCKEIKNHVYVFLHEMDADKIPVNLATGLRDDVVEIPEEKKKNTRYVTLAVYVQLYFENFESYIQAQILSNIPP